ncbi:hypothetical protein Fot_30712 [Forsythia ovata]|uniref:Uncharacterized protein n=1 Tax=Forsythia ovata TaxID=205694 RepID=A0ABD1T363_9LAMI
MGKWLAYSASNYAKDNDAEDTHHQPHLPCALESWSASHLPGRTRHGGITSSTTQKMLTLVTMPSDKRRQKHTSSATFALCLRVLVGLPLAQGNSSWWNHLLYNSKNADVHGDAIIYSTG